MSRNALLVLLGAQALACAPTVVTIHGRSVDHAIGGDVREVEPGHWAGTYKNAGLNIDHVGDKDEEVLACTETGTFDGVWLSATEIKSCTSQGTRDCRAKDGSTNTGESTATCRVGPNGELIFEGTGKQVNATGRFEGSQATFTFTAWQVVPPPGVINFGSYTTTVTLPKK